MTIIWKCIAANPVKNGSIVTLQQPTTAGVQTINTYVTNLPTTGTINTNYDNRGTGVRYYTGDSAS